MAYRLADALFSGVVSKCDYCIDFHTAAVRRTNFPHVRGNLDNPEVKRIAAAFGCELVLHKLGSRTTLRAVATRNGCATLLYEAGEVLKFEPGTIQLGTRGVWNVLKTLGMMDGQPVNPAYQTVVKKTLWVRAETGGILRFHVRPGEIVEKGAPIAACERLFTDEAEEIVSPVSGVVLGMTTLPAVKPGEPVCHLAVPEMAIAKIKAAIAREPTTLHRKLTRELSTNFVVEKSRPAGS